MKKSGQKHHLAWRIIFLFTLLVYTSSLYGQIPKVTMHMKDAYFVDVINNLRQQTGIKLLYNLENVRDKRCSTIDLDSVPASAAIDQIMSLFNLNYSMVEDVVVIEEKTTTMQNTRREISGRVVDKSGDPLPGATVMLKGTQIAISTDRNGMFSFMLPESKEYVFIITFIGMEKKEVKYTGDGPLVIELEAEDSSMDEVVVTGYQTINRKDMVGAYTILKMEDIIMPAYTSIDQMLQGQVPGMVVVNKSSRVGRNPSITIRGTSTILGNSDPLWVVDGITQPDPLPFDVSGSLTSDLSQIVGNQISWLNPSDIETITILKDASATAIYGSKASNGVIVVTTKRGKTEKISIRYSGNFSVRQRPTYDMFDFMNSQERILFSKEAYDAGARYQSEPLPQLCTYEGLMNLLNNRLITEDVYNKNMKKLETVNTDWFKILTRNSLSHNHNLSLSGGANKTNYMASLSFSQQKGIEKGNDTENMSFRLNVNTSLRENLRISLSLFGSFSDTDGYGAGVNPLSYATTTSRALPAYEDNGEYLFYKEYYQYQLHAKNREYGYNILNEMNNTYSKNKNERFDVSLNLDWKITEWLTYQLVGGIARGTTRGESYAGEKTTYVAKNYRGYDYGAAEVNSDLYKAAMLPFGGEYFTTSNSSASYNIQNKLLVSKTFNENQRLNVMLGVEVRSNDVETRSNTVWGYVPERGEKIIRPTPIKDLVLMDGLVRTFEWGILDNLYNGKWANTTRTDNHLSLFGTLTYSFGDRYVLNANIRADASNRFGQDVNKRMDPTYSFGFSWRVAEESFIKDNISWLNQLNLRATYGIQGYVLNTLSPELIVRQAGIMSLYQQYYVTISSLPNPLLKWERTRTWDFGLDLQLFNGITMGVDYYGRRSNAVIDQDVPQEYGTTTMKLNGGRIYNHGIEFSMNITPYKRKDFAWTIGFNASKNWNKSESDDADLETITKANFLSTSGNRLLKKGYPLHAFWSYSFDKLSEEGYPLFNKFDQVTDDPTDFLVYSGESQPYFTGGFNTNIRYKSVSVSASFAALLGSKKRLPNPYSSFSNGKIPSPIDNISKELNNRWKKPGDEEITKIPALYTALTGFNYDVPDGKIESMYTLWGNSDMRVANASFLRCRQISVNWYLNKTLCAKIGANSLSLSGTLNNVFVIASKKFNGFDPELGNSVMPRIFSLGLSVGF